MLHNIRLPCMFWHICGDISAMIILTEECFLYKASENKSNTQNQQPTITPITTVPITTTTKNTPQNMII